MLAPKASPDPSLAIDWSPLILASLTWHCPCHVVLGHSATSQPPFIPASILPPASKVPSSDTTC